MARPTKAQQALIAERRAHALRLRVAGVEPLAIGQRLHADPRENSQGVSFPQGYGQERFDQGKTPLAGKKLITRVCQDLAIALQQRREDLSMAVADMRTLENERLDQYQLAVHQHAVGRPARGSDPAVPPNLDALDKALKIMTRRARLNGLDAPTEVSGPGGNALVVEIDPDLLPNRMDTDQPDVVQAPTATDSSAPEG